MNEKRNQDPPPINQVLWILWGIILFSTSTLLFVIMFKEFNGQQPASQEIEKETYISIFFSISLVASFVSRMLHNKAKVILTKLSTDTEEKKKQIGKAFIPILFSWIIGTELNGVLGLYLYFSGGPDFLQYSYGLCGFAFLIHFINRPPISIKG